MKHGVAFRKLNRTSEHRWAMLRYVSHSKARIEGYLLMVLVLPYYSHLEASCATQTLAMSK